MFNYKNKKIYRNLIIITILSFISLIAGFALYYRNPQIYGNFLVIYCNLLNPVFICFVCITFFFSAQRDDSAILNPQSKYVLAFFIFIISETFIFPFIATSILANTALRYVESNYSLPANSSSFLIDFTWGYIYGYFFLIPQIFLHIACFFLIENCYWMGKELKNNVQTCTNNEIANDNTQLKPTLPNSDNANEKEHLKSALPNEIEIINSLDMKKIENKYELLNKIYNLYLTNAITEEEYLKLKEKILSSD